MAKVTIITLGECIAEVDNTVSGQAKVKKAIELLYSKGEVIGQVDRKGETYYILTGVKSGKK